MTSRKVLFSTIAAVVLIAATSIVTLLVYTNYVNRVPASTSNTTGNTTPTQNPSEITSFTLTGLHNKDIVMPAKWKIDTKAFYLDATKNKTLPGLDNSKLLNFSCSLTYKAEVKESLSYISDVREPLDGTYSYILASTGVKSQMVPMNDREMYAYVASKASVIDDPESEGIGYIYKCETETGKKFFVYKIGSLGGVYFHEYTSDVSGSELSVTPGYTPITFTNGTYTSCSVIAVEKPFTIVAACGDGDAGYDEKVVKINMATSETNIVHDCYSKMGPVESVSCSK